MTPKEYLSQVCMLDLRISQRKKEKDSLPDDNTAVSECEALKQKIDLLTAEYIALKDKIISEIQGLNNIRYVSVLYKKYIEYKPIKAIAYETGLSYQYLVELHGKALKAFGKLYCLDEREVTDNVDNG